MGNPKAAGPGRDRVLALSLCGEATHVTVPERVGDRAAWTLIPLRFPRPGPQAPGAVLGITRPPSGESLAHTRPPCLAGRWGEA